MWALLVVPHPADGADVVVPDWGGLRAAFLGAADHDVVTLARGSAITNATGENLVVPAGASITLDLNGSSLDISISDITQSPLAAINVPATSTLTVEDSGSTGVLVAAGDPTFGNAGAGIGATGGTDDVGTVTIRSGTVHASGGYQAAGIGGANYPGGIVEIRGGDVTAVGGNCAAGIGGGWSGSGGTVTMTGGRLHASGETAVGSGCDAGGGVVPGTLTLAGAPIAGSVAEAGIGGAALTPGVDNGRRYSATQSGSSFTVTYGQVLSFVTAGTAVADQFVATGQTPTRPADPTRAHHDFNGWSTDSSGATPFDFGDQLSSDENAYAQWLRQTYSVSFVMGGHGAPIAAESVGYGELATPPADPSEPGWEFDGWYADAALTSPFDFSSSITGLVTLHAGWTEAPPTPTPTPTVVADLPPSPPGPSPTTETSGPAPQPTEPVRQVQASPSPTAVPAAALPAAPDPNPTQTVHSPSFLTNSIRDLDDVLDDPLDVAQAAAYATVWILALVCTVRLLGKTLSMRYQAWSAKVAGRTPPRLVAAMAAISLWWRTHPRSAIWLVLGSTTLVTVALQPNFSVSAFGLRLVCSLLLAQAVITLASRYLAASWARRMWGLPVSVKPAGWSVLIAVAGLGVSKALHFVPGLLQGGATDVDTGRRPMRDADFARAEQVRVWLSWTVAMVAWLAVSELPASASVWSLTLHDALVAIAVAGLGGLFIELIPLPALIGGTLWRYRPRQWIAVTAATTLSFLVIVAPQASNWIEVAGLGRWVTIMTLFTILAVIVIVVVNRRVRQELTEDSLD